MVYTLHIGQVISVSSGLVVMVIEWLVLGEGGGFHLNDLGTLDEEPEEFYYQGDFRLYPKHLQGVKSDNSVLECIPDSSKG